jgi:hypothetical protein
VTAGGTTDLTNKKALRSLLGRDLKKCYSDVGGFETRDSPEGELSYEPLRLLSVRTASRRRNK